MNELVKTYYHEEIMNIAFLPQVAGDSARAIINAPMDSGIGNSPIHNQLPSIEQTEGITDAE